jgi:sec-independent protein translocase protein TatC
MAHPEDNKPIVRRLTDPRAMSFGDHLEELRKRLIWAIASVAPLFIVSLVFGEQLLDFIIHPAQQRLLALGQPATMLQTNPIELLSAWLKVAMVVTIVVGIPLILLQLWLFVAPGLYQHEQRFAKILLPMSVLLSLLGLAFLYYVMLPAMLTFLINFGMDVGKIPAKTGEAPAALTLPTWPVLDADPPHPPAGAGWIYRPTWQIHFNVGTEAAPDIRQTQLIHNAGVSQQYKISEYVGLIFTTSLAFIAGFQTPVVVLLLGWTGLVSRATMAKKRRYAVFVSAAGAAVLAPSPDPFSMIVLAIPLYMLYELGLFLLQVLPASRVARGFGKPKPPIETGASGPAPSPRQPESARREGPDAGDE